MDISEGVSVGVHYILSLFVCSSVGFRYTLTQTDKRAHPHTIPSPPASHLITQSFSRRCSAFSFSLHLFLLTTSPLCLSAPRSCFSFVCERALWVSLPHLFQLCVHVILEDRINIVVYSLFMLSKNFLESDNQITCAHYSLQNMSLLSESFAGCFRPFLTNDSMKQHPMVLRSLPDKHQTSQGISPPLLTIISHFSN